MVNKKVPKKVIAKRSVKKVNPLEQTAPMITAMKQSKQPMASMNIPVPAKKIVAKKKKKAVKKPKFNYSKSFKMK